MSRMEKCCGSPSRVRLEYFSDLRYDIKLSSHKTTRASLGALAYWQIGYRTLGLISRDLNDHMRTNESLIEILYSTITNTTMVRYDI